MTSMSLMRITRRSLLKSLTFGAALPLALGADDESEVSIMEFNDAGEKTGLVRVKRVAHTEAEWRKLLTLQQFYVSRKHTSDLPYYGSYFKLHDAGIYRCVCCETAVFSSSAKFDSRSGFPCFSAPIAEENIHTFMDPAEEPKRIDVLCKRCDAHLGYEYNDGPPPTQLRYALNQSSLKFVPFKKSAGGA
jgi:peptide-methionine (R)-S-oxide reductase